jgi:hypothetical protein
MTPVAVLSADLVANSSSFETALQRADRRMQQSQSVWQNALSASKANFNSLSGVLSAFSEKFDKFHAIASAVGVAGLVEIARKTIDMASALNDASERLGVNTDLLQKYQYAAAQVGVDLDTMSSAMMHLNANIADGKLKFADTTQALESIVSAVAKAKTGVEKLAIVNDAFGPKLGAKMLPIIEGIKQFGQEAIQTGNVIDGSLIKSADDLGDSFTSLGAAIKNNVASGFLKAFTDQSGDLASIYKDPEFAKGLQQFGSLLGGISADLLSAAAGIGKFTTGWGSWIMAIQKDMPMVNALATALSLIDKFRHSQDQTPLVSPEDTAAYAKVMGFKTPQQYGPPQQTVTPPPYVSTKQNQSAAEAAKKAVDLAETRKKQFADILSDLQRESDSVDQQISLYGQKDAVIQRSQQELQIENKLRKDGITLTTDQSAAIQSYLDHIQAQNDKLHEMQELGDGIGSAFENAFDAAVSGGEKLSDVLRNLGVDIAKVIEQVLIMEPLENSLKAAIGGALPGGLEGLFSGLFGGGGGDLTEVGTSAAGSVTLSGMRAAGGPVTAGQSYLVGEMGKEIFTPQQNGMIIPNSDLRTSSGGDQYYIDARGADQAAISRLEASLSALNASIERRALGAVQDKFRRSSRFGKYDS